MRLRSRSRMVALITMAGLICGCTATPAETGLAAVPGTSAATPVVAPTAAQFTEPTTAPTPGPTRGPIRTGMIATGSTYSCAGRLDGTVACWGGSGDEGEVGPVELGSPSWVPGTIPQLSNVAAIGTGTAHTCAVTRDGSVWCWGLNSDGQLGNGTQTDHEDLPVRVKGVSDAVAVGGGNEHTCALLASGGVACWGENRDGQLHDGTTTDRMRAVSVNGVHDGVALAVGFDHACVVRAGGTVACWGANNLAQLGDVTVEPRTRLVEPIGLRGAVAIAAGGGHSCALISDGTVRCWGANHSGQIGTGFVSEADPIEEVPATVVDIATAVAISAGGHHNCALLGDGTIRCWGYDNVGQLGFGGESAIEMKDRAHPVPVEVIGIRDAVAVSASPNAHTCALLTNGTAMCWGINDYGELGVDSVTYEPSRVPVPVTEFDFDLPG